jgi:Sjoegren syndrome nuclear autoantigen 1
MTEKNAIEKEIAALTERLRGTNEGLSSKLATKQEYDKAISETEGAYLKILESSQTLLHVLKRETVNLARK